MIDRAEDGKVTRNRGGLNIAREKRLTIPRLVVKKSPSMSFPFNRDDDDDDQNEKIVTIFEFYGPK